MPMRREAGSRSPNEIDIVVGQNVRRLRQAQQLTLQEMAASLGISHQQLQKYETGMNRLSAGMMPGVAETLGVDIADLFESAVPARPAGSASDRLRGECVQVLRRTSSSETLKTMSRVLKALSQR